MELTKEVPTAHDAGCAEAGPRPADLAARAEMISHLLQAHGGGIELLPSDASDVVRVRFVGLCTNCCLRPLTMANIVRPLLTDLRDVREVEVEGIRISTEGLERLQQSAALPLS
jgi:Fe-S cluster biogenesis protein NfuA